MKVLLPKQSASAHKKSLYTASSSNSSRTSQVFRVNIAGFYFDTDLTKYLQLKIGRSAHAPHQELHELLSESQVQLLWVEAIQKKLQIKTTERTYWQKLFCTDLPIEQLLHKWWHAKYHLRRMNRNFDTKYKCIVSQPCHNAEGFCCITTERETCITIKPVFQWLSSQGNCWKENNKLYCNMQSSYIFLLQLQFG